MAPEGAISEISMLVEGMSGLSNADFLPGLADRSGCQEGHGVGTLP